MIFALASYLLAASPSAVGVLDALLAAGGNVAVLVGVGVLGAVIRLPVTDVHAVGRARLSVVAHAFVRVIAVHTEIATRLVVVSAGHLDTPCLL